MVLLGVVYFVGFVVDGCVKVYMLDFGVGFFVWRDFGVWLGGGDLVVLVGQINVFFFILVD